MQARSFYAGYKKHIDPEIDNAAPAEEEEEEFELTADDPRHLLIAEKTEVLIDNYFKFTPRQGCEPEMRIYKALHPLVYVFQTLLMLDIFFSPPAWCKDLKDGIDADCRYKDDGVLVLRSPMPVFRTVIFEMGVPFALLFLSGMRTWKYRLIRRNYGEMCVCMFLVFTTLVYFTIRYIWPRFDLGDIPMGDLLIVIFIVAQIDSIRNCTLRMIAISVTGFEVIAVYIFLVLAYACLNRILLYTYPAKDTQDSEHVWISFGNRSLIYSVQSVLQFFPASNFPNYMVALANLSVGLRWLVIVQLFINSSLMVPIIQSSLYFYYQNFYVKILDKLKGNTRLSYLIGKEIKDDGEVHEVVHKYIVDKYCENPGWEFETDEELVKLRILYENEAADGAELEEKRNKFYTDNFPRIIKFRDSFVWNLLTFLFDFAQIVLVLWYTDYLSYDIEEQRLKISKETDPTKQTALKQDLIQMMINIQIYIMGTLWLLNVFAVTDVFLRILSKGWRGMFEHPSIALQTFATACIGMFFAIIISFPIGTLNYEVDASLDVTFGVCTTFICLKLFALILLHGSKIQIIKVLFDVLAKGFVLCKPLYAMFFYSHLIFAALGMDLFGGCVDSTSADKYKKYTGSDLESGQNYLSFNDYWCSLFTLYTIIFGGWNGTDNVSLAQNVKRYDKWFYEYFFVLWYFWSNLFLINIVSSFFVDNVMLAIGELPGGGAAEEEEAPADEEGEPLAAEVELGPVSVDVNANANYPAPPSNAIEIDTDVEIPVNVEVDINAPPVELEVEVGAPEVEVEVEVPEVEVEVEPVVGGEVEVDVEVAPGVEVEVEVPADVEIEVDAEPVVEGEVEVEVEVEEEPAE